MNEIKKQYHKKYYQKNKEKKKKYQIDKSDSIKKYKQEYYENNKDALLEKGREYRLNNKDNINEYNKEYYKNNEKVLKEKYKQYQQTMNGKFVKIKQNAKDRKLEFCISLEDYENCFYDKICFYCPKTNTIGIDRVDSEKGYLLSNCVPCCWACNRAKGDMSFNEFIEHINLIYNKVGKFRMVN